MNPDFFKVYAPMDGGASDMTVRGRTDVIDRLVDLRQVGECMRRSLAMRLLGDAAGNLKVEPAGFDVWNAYGSSVSFQVAANAER